MQIGKVFVDNCIALLPTSANEDVRCNESGRPISGCRTNLSTSTKLPALPLWPISSSNVVVNQQVLGSGNGLAGEYETALDFICFQTIVDGHANVSVY